MTKRRSCHRTIDEVKMHEKAVKLRKMTDEQLVHYIEDRVEKARSEGRNESKGGKKIKEYLDSLSAPGSIPGVGPATVEKLKKYAKEGGFLG